MHALLGENGAGKSSLMNIAAGLYAPEAARCSVDGTGCVRGPPDAQGAASAWSTSTSSWCGPSPAARTSCLPIRAARYQRRHAARHRGAGAREALRKLGFEHRPGRPVDTLSVAEQQRVEILKVLVAGAPS